MENRRCKGGAAFYAREYPRQPFKVGRSSYGMYTPVRKVFAEGQVLWRCLGGNGGTGTRVCIYFELKSKLPLPYFPQKCKLHFFQHHVHYLEISA